MLSSIRTHPWFYDSHFEGHFPSRILPNLYLGNLQHASNPLMLQQLGITHVVSVGESLLTPPRQEGLGSSFGSWGGDFGIGRPGMPRRENSLFWEHKEGRMQVWTSRAIDDGNDSIVPHLEKAVEFIDNAVRSGGKVLVHCQVGVSRSATVVIAYVMKKCQLDLASAYLLVRSRRLNIVIQPNCKIMWELWVWEGQLEEAREARSRALSPSSKAVENQKAFQRTKKIRISWSFLAREIGALNERYKC
ncbi:phosphatases II [Atractiella rhizophila]|nr:phosphatases II [Atractiella rhizophila]